MVRKVFTDALLKGAKAPLTGRVELSDMRCPGLEFRLTPTGARSFSFRFRDPTSGTVTRATIGPYPDISLSDARGAADTLRGKFSKGINPVTEKRRDREDADTRRLRAVGSIIRGTRETLQADPWCRRAKPAPAYSAEVEQTSL
jgi:hypothetical protein